jgi:hypothetical protein
MQVRAWMSIARTVAERGGDYANVSAWLTDAGFSQAVPFVSIVIFVALGVWLYRFRRADLWVRLGVVAIVTRFLTYHRVYDDVLIVLAFVALFRISMSSDSSRRAAAVLLSISMFFMLLPARLGTSAAPWRQLFESSHTLTWLAILVLLGSSRVSRWRPDRNAQAVSTPLFIGF